MLYASTTSASFAAGSSVEKVAPSISQSMNVVSRASSGAAASAHSRSMRTSGVTSLPGELLELGRLRRPPGHPSQRCRPSRRRHRHRRRARPLERAPGRRPAIVRLSTAEPYAIASGPLHPPALTSGAWRLVGLSLGAWFRRLILVVLAIIVVFVAVPALHCRSDFGQRRAHPRFGRRDARRCAEPRRVLGRAHRRRDQHSDPRACRTNGRARRSRATQSSLYCQSGGRSAMAKRLLESKGFTQVHDMGSMRSW